MPHAVPPVLICMPARAAGQRATVTALLLLLATPCQGQSLAPDVTQETVAETICVPGYTKTVRPSFWESQKTKLALLREAGEPWVAAPLYQLDHIVPLTLGGHPTERANLQLQPWAEAQRKDRIEAKLGCLVCTGQVSLQEAQKAITVDWEAAYHAYAKIKCRRRQ